MEKPNTSLASSSDVIMAYIGKPAQEKYAGYAIPAYTVPNQFKKIVFDVGLEVKELVQPPLDQWPELLAFIKDAAFKRISQSMNDPARLYAFFTKSALLPSGEALDMEPCKEAFDHYQMMLRINSKSGMTSQDVAYYGKEFKNLEKAPTVLPLVVGKYLERAESRLKTNILETEYELALRFIMSPFVKNGKEFELIVNSKFESY